MLSWIAIKVFLFIIIGPTSPVILAEAGILMQSTFRFFLVYALGLPIRWAKVQHIPNPSPEGNYSVLGRLSGQQVGCKTGYNFVGIGEMNHPFIPSLK